MNFKPDTDVLSDIKTKVEYYINYSNNMNFKRSNKRIVMLDNITLEQMRETLKDATKPKYNLAAKEAFNYELDLKGSVLNCSEIDAIKKCNVFLSSWILFNYQSLKDYEIYLAKSNPLDFIESQNFALAS